MKKLVKIIKAEIKQKEKIISDFDNNSKKKNKNPNIVNAIGRTIKFINDYSSKQTLEWVLMEIKKLKNHGRNKVS